MAEMDIKYLTTQRDCIEVPEDAYAYTDGCHSDLPANGPVRALILETFAVSFVIHTLNVHFTLFHLKTAERVTKKDVFTQLISKHFLSKS